ncbi:MAG: hypothetical protein D6722_10685 [Bacteroidetes bacterium]|nr:MAG: hypothetical protein D6722_10685 [Bacteroidota bacterium]
MRHSFLLLFLFLGLISPAQPLPKMIFIEGGTFDMGSEDALNVSDYYENEQPIHTVSVSSFYMGETEVTFDQFDYFCEQTGREKPVSQKTSFATWGRGNRPVINVSWQDAQDYCEWLGEQTGDYYRLPTEAEWEYAAGGGAENRTKWSGTSKEGDLWRYAYWDKNGDYVGPRHVKSKQPNQLGLYDMSGNAGEWCYDWYRSDYYSYSPEVDPEGPRASQLFGGGRVVRGGDWRRQPVQTRVAWRWRDNPENRSDMHGFRVVMVP